MMGNEYSLITNYMCIEGRLQKVWIISIFERFKWKYHFILEINHNLTLF